jgi:hypothetical protein
LLSASGPTSANGTGPLTVSAASGQLIALSLEAAQSSATTTFQAEDRHVFSDRVSRD